jgi:hypothetical protein
MDCWVEPDVLPEANHYWILSLYYNNWEGVSMAAAGSLLAFDRGS